MAYTCNYVCCFGFWICFFFIFALHKKEKEFIEEMIRKLPDVEYTEIVSSSNVNSGTIATFNSNCGVG